MVNTTTAKKLSERVFLSIFGSLTPTHKAHFYLLTIQDDVIKFSAALPLITPEAIFIAKAFVEGFIY